MATVDLTGGQGTGASMPSRLPAVSVMEATIDIAKLIADGTVASVSTGDVFQVIDLPAECYILHCGAEVITAFDATSPVADIDVNGGDDFVDGGDLSSTGYLAAGTNGHVDYTAVATFNNRVTSSDTIDVTITCTGNPTVGVLRVYVILADISGKTEKQIHTY